ncbi:MAG: phosphoribosylglycinamide formyltransferase [Wenzhouxiangellaceae bacterium]|nr:phosphoribosylglycinamide formyltransferase [Wenzhouxiangellaceae bacterium]
MSLPGLVILISGRGSNALAIAEAIDDGRLPARIHAVIADRPAAGLARMADRGIDTALVPRKSFSAQAPFERALTEVIESYAPGLVALAGFMRVLSADLVTHFSQRMVNIHPSLLPKYRGLDTHQRALAAADAEHGASVHWVTPELDAGPVIAQARVPVRPEDTRETLAERVLEQEHRLYPAALALLIRNPVLDLHDISKHREPPLLDLSLDAAGHLVEPAGGD